MRECQKIKISWRKSARLLVSEANERFPFFFLVTSLFSSSFLIADDYLLGQINKHKNQSHTHTNSHVGEGQHVARRPHPTSWVPYRGRPYQRRMAAPHRNRTLVMNNSTVTPNYHPGQPMDNNEGEASSSPAGGGGGGWVARRDRHMQLINSAIYDKDAQARTKAKEETRKLKTQKRAQVERAKVLRYAQLAANRVPAVATVPTPGQGASVVGGQGYQGYQILVNEIPFRISQGGSKLIRMSGAIPIETSLEQGASLPLITDDPRTASNTPKRVAIAGVNFVRSKSGNLHRLGAVTSKRWGPYEVSCVIRSQQLTEKSRKPTTTKKKNELCRRFTTTGTSFKILDLSTMNISNPLLCFCKWTSILTFLASFFIGTCYKGPSCSFVHDPNKVAICKEFLQTGKCSAGMNCDLSHEPSPHRSPACMHFLRGRCSNPECRYAHIRVNPGAPVCRDFATLGYCEKGATCEERHVHECPDYANTGTCSKKRCRLPHVDRAGQIRKIAANKAGSPDEDADLSSEQEEYDEIDSDDVNSDDEDEEEDDDDSDTEIIIGGVDSGEVAEQRDFVRF